MPESQWIQKSFNGGEISPRVYSRGDIASYESGAKRVENLIPLIAGGLERRPGTRYVAEVHDSEKKHRLLPFQFSATQNYRLEFGDRTLRFYRDGGLILQDTVVVQSPAQVNNLPESLESEEMLVKDGDGPWRITTDDTLPGGLLVDTDYYLRVIPTHIATTANIAGAPDFLTAAGHRFKDEMGPMRVVATRKDLGLDLSETYYIRAVSGDDFSLSKTLDDATPEDLTGTVSGIWTVKPTPRVERTVFGLALTSTGAPISISSKGVGKQTLTRTESIPLLLQTPYSEDEIFGLKIAQSGDVLYITHPNHPPHRLLRFSHTSWHLEPVDTIDGPYDSENSSATEIDADQDGPAPGVLFDATNGIFNGWHAGQPIRYSDDGVRQGWGKITEVNAQNFDDTELLVVTFTSTNVNVATDRFNASSHALFTGDETRFIRPTGTLPSPLLYDTSYWAIRINPSTFKLASSYANAIAGIAIDLTHVGEASVTHTLTTAAINFGGHSFTEDDGPYFLTAHHRLPKGWQLGRAYYLKILDVNHIALLDEPGGQTVAPLELGPGGQYQMHGGPTPHETCYVEVHEDIVAVLPGASKIWRLPAWGGAPGPGFPAAVGFSEQRLFFAGSRLNPHHTWLSQSADFHHFGPDQASLPDPITPGGSDPSDHAITDSSGITAQLVSGEINLVHWLAELRVMVAGTAGGLWRIQSSALIEPLTPTNINPHMSANTASANIQGIKANEVLIYLCASRCRLLSAEYDATKDVFVPIDMNLIADHIIRPGVKEMCWAPVPWQSIWCAKDDGEIATMTYNPLQEVTAWARQNISGTWDGDINDEDDLGAQTHGVVESITATGSGTESTERYSQVWMIVKRTINGETKRYVEYLTPRFEIDTDIEDAAFPDSHLVPYDGVAKTSFTGLDHLEGETVGVWADGADQADQIVSGGAVTIATAASKVVIGLKTSNRFEMLPFKFEVAKAGSARGRFARNIETGIGLYRTMGLKLGVDEASLVNLDFRSVSHDMDSPPPLFSGTYYIRPDDHWDREGTLLLGQDGLGPLTLIGLESLVSWEAR